MNSRRMPERSLLSDISDDPSFQLWMDFDNVCDRYLSLIDQKLPSMLPEVADAIMGMAYLERTIVLATRRDQRTFHLMMRRVRSQQWHGADRERLSRYVAMIAMFPTAFEDAENIPPGEDAGDMTNDRRKLLADHPYLFNESWPEEGEGYEGLMDDLVKEMDTEIWGDKDSFAMDSDTEGLLHLQAIDQMFLEEGLPILTTIREACSRLADEGLPSLSEGALEIINSKEPDTSCMLARFVLECMFLHHLRSVDPWGDEELMESWQEGIELGRVEMDMSQEALDSTLRMLIEMHGTEEDARRMMAEAAEAAAELIGKKALPIMLKAADVAVDDRNWRSLTHDLVLLQLDLNVGAEENIRRMVEQGRTDGRPTLLCTINCLKARCYLKKGMGDRATNVLKELAEIIRGHINEDEVIFQIPEAAFLMKQNGMRSAAKRVLESGLKATANRPELEWLRHNFGLMLHQL